MSSKNSQCQPSQYLLNANLDKVNHLFNENPIKHAAKISNLLLWIATFHPNLLEGEAKKLCPTMFIRGLYFPYSWKFPNQLLPTDSLITLLRSRVCDELQTFCGYVSPQVLKNLPIPMNRLQLSLGMHTDVKSILEELQSRQRQQYADIEIEYEDLNVEIHFRCGEVDIEDLSSMSGNGRHINISDMSIDNIPWAVQAISALQPKAEDKPDLRYSYLHNCYIDNLDFESLLISCSTLTKTDVETLAKGLLQAGINLDCLVVSGPEFGHGYGEWIQPKCYFNDDEDKFCFGDLLRENYKIKYSGFTDECILDRMNDDSY